MQPFLLEPGENKVVDRRLDPMRKLRVVLAHGQRRLGGLLKRPVRPVHRALLDPLFEDRNLFGLHRLGFALGRLRHQGMRVLRFDAPDQLALLRMSGDDGVRLAGPLAERRLLKVQPQPSLAHLRVGTMAAEAVAGQNRLYILVEVQALPGPQARLRAAIALASRGYGHQDTGDQQGRCGRSLLRA